MPISSQGKRRQGADRDGNLSQSQQFAWRPVVVSSSETIDATNKQQQQQNNNSRQINKNNANRKQSTFQVRRQVSKVSSVSSASSSVNQMKRPNKIRSISQPDSCATTSMALNNRLSESNEHHILKSPTLSLAGQLILAGKQPNSLEANLKDSPSASKAPNSLSLLSNQQQQQQPYKFNNQSSQGEFYLSRSSLASQQQHHSQASSTTQLHPNHHRNSATDTNSTRLAGRLNISSRNMNLKYVKTLIIILMSLDLLMTILLHQFATQDQMQLWLTSYKMRFSLLNLVLSAIWFVVLVGAILFDVHFILVIACIVDVGSFILLLILSIIHFYKRIDYNTVQLTSLFVLLFSLIFLHVYLLALSALTIYLTGAVKRRKRSLSTG